MNDLKKAISRPITNAGRDMVVALFAMANLVEEYSNDEDNPNVSAWLRGGAVDLILRVEQECAELYY